MSIRSIFFIAVFMLATPVAAGEKALTQSVAVFAGRFTQADFPGNAFVPWGGNQENNYNFGAMYNRDYLELGAGFYLGGEVGAAVRFGVGEPTSAEIWGGASFRHSGLNLGPVNIAPRFTIGLSVVSNTIGVETQRANAAGSKATLLAYLGPEIAVSLKQLPKTEFFFRTHHRSGALGTFSNMREGHNSHIFGVRRSF